MLRPAAVFVIKGWQDELVSLELALLHAGQGWRRRVPPLGDEDDKGERLTGVLQQFLVQQENEPPQCWLSNNTSNESYGKETLLLLQQCRSSDHRLPSASQPCCEGTGPVARRGLTAQLQSEQLHRSVNIPQSERPWHPSAPHRTEDLPQKSHL